jgi:hypothetical protein
LDKHVIGKNDPAQFSEKWQQKFMKYVLLTSMPIQTLISDSRTFGAPVAFHVTTCK